MSRHVTRSGQAELVDPGGSAPPRPSPLSATAVADAVAVVGAACQGRRSGYSGLEAAVQAVCRSAGFEVGHVYLSCTGEGRILPSRIWFLQPPTGRFAAFVRTTASSPLVPGQGLPGQVVCAGAPVVIDALPGSAHMLRARAALAAGLRAACGYPLVVNPELTVVFEFLATGPIHPSTDLDALMEQLGRVLVPHLRELEYGELL